MLDEEDTEARISAALGGALDALPATARVCVVGTTSRLELLEPGLRRPGRFDREVEVPPPTAAERRLILAGAVGGSGGVEVAALARRMAGFVGADVQLAAREARWLATQRAVREAAVAGTAPAGGAGVAAASPPLLPAAQIDPTPEEWLLGASSTQPSAIRDIAVTSPGIRWSDIGGYEEVKRQVRELAEWPTLMPGAFEQLGVAPPHGILLYGPPGTGKTMLAKALASAGSMNFISVRGPEFLSKYVGDSEKMVQRTFERARACAPCVVFLDEVDAVAAARGSAGDSSGVRGRVVNQLLQELDGFKQLRGVVVVAATNRPDVIDPALTRPGRLGRIVYVPLPDEAARRSIFEALLRRTPHHAGVSAEHLARRTEGYSGAECAAVVREAAMRAIAAAASDAPAEELLVTADAFQEALDEVKPATTAAAVAWYDAFRLGPTASG